MMEWAFSEKGELIHIDEADRNLHSHFFCVECGDVIIAKNRQFEGRVKTYHFAHVGNHSCGVGEGDIHFNTKCAFYRKLLDCLNAGIPYTAYIITKKALANYDFNILDGVTKIEMEKSTLHKFRPDISLISDDKLVKAIEIVHTHEDSESKTEAYIENGVGVCKIYMDENKYEAMKNGAMPRIRMFDEPMKALCRPNEKPHEMVYRYLQDETRIRPMISVKKYDDEKTIDDDHSTKGIVIENGDRVKKSLICLSFGRVSRDITKSFNEEAIESAYKRGFITKWDEKFYIDIKNKRRLSPKQISHKIRINKSILDECQSRDCSILF